MMDDIEVAWLLLKLLAGTRTYKGVRFATIFDTTTEEIMYAKGLFRALPRDEQLVVKAAFDEIYQAVAARRIETCHATPAAPEYVQ